VVNRIRTFVAQTPARQLATSTHRLVGAGVSLVAGVATLAFLFWPSLQPEKAPQAFGATIRGTQYERGVTLGDVYTRRGDPPTANLSAADLAALGVLVSFDVTIEGYKEKALPLTWTVLDAPTMSRVPEAYLIGRPGWPDGRFVPEGQKDQANAQVWVQLPTRAGSYVIRLELFAPDGSRLTSLDSEPIVVAASAPAVPTDANSTAPAPAGLPTPSAP
jgi:hypothetical protein